MALSFAIRVIVDIFLLSLVALPILLFYLIGEPFKRGFFCTDTTIKYPYKDSTVTSAVLYIFGTVIPVITIASIEYFYSWKQRSSSDKRERLKKYAQTLYRILGAFFFGCAASHLVVDICKYSIGRLRPHFIDVCQPNLSLVNCSSNPLKYITDDVCTSQDAHRMKEARLSFISGHASFSTFTMFYLIIYLQAYWKIKELHIVRPLLQSILFILALFTSLSRLSDYKHHWQDVLTGFINGLSFAILISVFVARMFHMKHRRVIHQDSVENYPLQHIHTNTVAEE